MKHVSKLTMTLAALLVVAASTQAQAQDPTPAPAPTPGAVQVLPPGQTPSDTPAEPADEAPSGHKWSERVFVNLAVFNAYQSRSSYEASRSSTFTLYDESATVSSKQTIESSDNLIDISGGIRLWWNFGVGMGYTKMDKFGSGTVEAKIPHPLLYDQPRTASATISELAHKEEAVHLFATFTFPVTEKILVAVSGGPTFFSLEQDLLNTPQVSEVGPPYTSVQLTKVEVVNIKTKKNGYNFAGDVTYKFTKYFGLNGFVRYTGAKADIGPDGGSTTEIKIGGVQMGAGLRVAW